MRNTTQVKNPRKNVFFLQCNLFAQNRIRVFIKQNFLAFDATITDHTVLLYTIGNITLHSDVARRQKERSPKAESFANNGEKPTIQQGESL